MYEHCHIRFQVQNLSEDISRRNAEYSKCGNSSDHARMNVSLRSIDNNSPRVSIVVYIYHIYVQSGAE